MQSSMPRGAAENPTQYNIDAIARMEHDAVSRRTPTERVSNLITKFVGSMGFLLAQLILLVGWSLINLNLIPGVKAFDPFPFGVLALVVSWSAGCTRPSGRGESCQRDHCAAFR